MSDGSKGPTRARRREGLGVLFQPGLREVTVGKDLNAGQWGGGASWIVWSLEQGRPAEGAAGWRLEPAESSGAGRQWPGRARS